MTVPALVAGAGDRAALRFLEFFTVNIRNPNTRAAYARSTGDFPNRREKHGGGLDLRDIQPVHVAAYIEELQVKRSTPTVKQHLACIRMMFDWLVIGQVVPSNPAHAVRRPRYSVSTGSTPAPSSEEARVLLESIDIAKEVKRNGMTLKDPLIVALRDRALIGVMTYAFARVGAVVALAVEHYYLRNKRWWLRLHERNGKLAEMPCHHKLEEYLDAYIEAAGLFKDRKGPLFRSAIGKTGALTGTNVPAWRTRRMTRGDEKLERFVSVGGTDLRCGRIGYRSIV